MEKIRKIVTAIVILSFLAPSNFFISGVRADDMDISTDYLKNQTPDPWITMALISSGANPDLDYLKSVSGNSATDFEKNILALTASGKDPRSFSDVDFVSLLENQYRENQIGASNLLNDDFWGVLALISAGATEDGQIIQDSKNFILRNQNGDGGWSYAVSGQSDTNDTAIAIMALIEAGVPSNDPAINKAVDFLKSNQNDDGGFSYQTGSESDSGSDAWVVSAIYKLRQNPAEWTKNNQNPVGHLKSLQRSDGSFKWVASEDKGYPTLTAYAVIALNQSYYPISRLYQLRIEGKDKNICDAIVGAKTALDIVKNGALVCNYDYSIEDSSWGPYLKKINGEEAQGMAGWLYFVDNASPQVGANDYALNPGDEVLWYFGEWGAKPARLVLSSKKINAGETVKAKVEYFDNSLWNPLSSSTVYVSTQNFVTDGKGEVDFTLNNTGYYRIYAEKPGYVRTNQIALSVGGGVSKNIGLKVEITPPAPEIAFLVDKSLIDFGALVPGGATSSQLLVRNNGRVKIRVTGAVNGDSVFKENMTLNGLNWADFSASLDNQSEKNISVGLNIPDNWTNLGIKNGNLTLWATISGNED